MRMGGLLGEQLAVTAATYTGVRARLPVADWLTVTRTEGGGGVGAGWQGAGVTQCVLPCDVEANSVLLTVVKKK